MLCTYAFVTVLLLKHFRPRIAFRPTGKNKRILIQNCKLLGSPGFFAGSETFEYVSTRLCT
jgi:hypothetical protein